MNLWITRNRLYYRIILVALLIISVFVLIKLFPTLISSANISGDDFVRFWAGGRLNLQGKNPYDPQRIEELQIKVGDLLSGPNTITYPPWAITLLMPFGLLEYPYSRITWMLISIILILISTLILWRIYSGESNKRGLFILIAFVFAPTISVLEKGQITGLILFGISGFLYFSVFNRNDWFTGIFLAIASVKPQMILIFWIAVLFWIIQERRWIVLIATASTVSTLVLIAMFFNTSILHQFLGMLQQNRISDWATPTLGSYLRFYWLGLNHFWVQFLPLLLGFIWFIFYWYRHHSNWDWRTQMPIILLVSLLTSPYFWTYDVVILIPVSLVATLWLIADRKYWTSGLLLLAYFVINLLDLGLHIRLDDFSFIWLVPALFVWFLMVRYVHTDRHRNSNSLLI